jgi:hypothetical protein
VLLEILHHQQRMEPIGITEETEQHLQCFINGYQKLHKQNFAHKTIISLQARSFITLPSDIGLYFLGSSFILLCDKCLGTAMDNDLLGRGFSATCKTVRSYNQTNPLHMWYLLMAPLVLHLPNQQPPYCYYLYCPPALHKEKQN